MTAWHGSHRDLPHVQRDALAVRLRARRSSVILLATALLGHSGMVTALRSDTERLSEASRAITSLEVERATELLQEIRAEGPRVSFERARLALYRGDCSSARAILSAPTFAGKKEPELLLDLAEACAGALSDAVEVRDETQGVLLRAQDEKDQVLAPFISAVAIKARDTMKRELGIALPRPLRIDLVRDNFSLSAVTGLPLTATETTGTVAVARWGRVVMISPRAAPEGYPWQDTLAHEIVHLALTQATGDHAPLWLQEGLAKLNEAAWREPRAFDGSPDPSRVAANALASGKSVGIDAIGPSVAMLSSTEQASIAYAEVESFTRFWITENGKASLELLLRDIRGLNAASVDPAMVSVTGHALKTWIGRWHEHLRTMSLSGEDPTRGELHPARGVAAAVRMGDLLAARSHSAEAAIEFELADSESPGHPAIRWRLARSLFLAGNPDVARERLGSLDDLRGLHAGWLAMRATLSSDQESSDQERKAVDYATAVGLHPYLEEAACRGSVANGSAGARPAPDSAAAGSASPSELDPPRELGDPPHEPSLDRAAASSGAAEDAWVRLCGAARRFPSD